MFDFQLLCLLDLFLMRSQLCIIYLFLLMSSRFSVCLNLSFGCNFFFELLQSVLWCLSFFFLVSFSMFFLLIKKNYLPLFLQILFGSVLFLLHLGLQLHICKTTSGITNALLDIITLVFFWFFYVLNFFSSWFFIRSNFCEPTIQVQ